MRYSAHDKSRRSSGWSSNHICRLDARFRGNSAFPDRPFTRWYDRYQRGGPEGLRGSAFTAGSGLEPYPRGYPQPDCRPGAGSAGTEPGGNWQVRFTDETEYFVSEASRVYLAAESARSYLPARPTSSSKRPRSSSDQDHGPQPASGRLDFTYLKITGWGWYYLSTVLDDFSRFIVAWKLCATMKAKDVTATLDLALAASSLDQMTVVHRPRLLSDSGASYVAGDLAEWLDRQEMEHVLGAPYHPQTQGKIERWHQTLKNRILLEHYYLPGDLERQVAAFVAHYNHARLITRASTILPRLDVYFGRAEAVLLERERIKLPDNRKPSLAASTACRIISITDDPEPPFRKPAICLKSSDDGHHIAVKARG